MAEVQGPAWGQIFRQMARQCPQCHQTWLLPNLRPGEWHTCKACGRRFAAAPDPAKPSGKPSVTGEEPPRRGAE
jgi:ribosomal protein L37AE/L43A